MSNTPTTEDYLGEIPPDRIIGSECEYNIQVVEGSGLSQYDYIKPEAIAAAGYASIHGFLDNGFHMYVDVGHLEIDTPECLGPRQAAIADCAGILLLGGIVEASTHPHAGVHRHTGTVIGDSEMTSGYHENYMFPRDLARSSLLDTVMASHLTSRMWAGDGGLKHGFELSQKVDGIGGPAITRRVERRTEHGYKPMAMIPPASDDSDTIGDSQWARLEVRFGDAGLSPTARYLCFAATSLVLRLIEHPDLVDIEELRGLSFTTPALTAKAFSKDLSFRELAQTDNGSLITAVNYQEVLAQAAMDLADKIDLPEDEVAAIKLWLTVCDELKKSDLENGEYGSLIRLLDFAPRHHYLTRHFPTGLSSRNNDAVKRNLLWDRVLPSGVGTAYWAATGSEYIGNDEPEAFLHQPPANRAQRRGELIERLQNRIRWVNWSGLETSQGQVIDLRDPYATEEQE